MSCHNDKVPLYKVLIEETNYAINMFYLQNQTWADKKGYANNKEI